MKNQFKCYVINLPDNTKRKELFLKEWKNRHPVDFIEAVDTRHEKWLNFKHHLSEKALSELEESLKNKKRKEHYMLCPGAIGCYLSHLKCWENFVKTDKNYCLIFEDDTTIPEKIFPKLKNIITTIKSEWDMIFLGGAFIKKENFNDELIRIYSFFYTHAYILNKNSAIKLMQKHDKIEKQIDAYFSDISKEFVILGTKKILCEQKNSCYMTNIQTLTV